ncbi:MAG: DUF5989 family protein [Planctomycetota bacterium]|nr:DUF5989 family protein [Planctomycetota bacterium]MDA1252309.1 DUF5989 family protein [Planctomycetota bacterium]
MSSQLSEFEQLNQESSTGTAREFWLFIVENKCWWMIPILVIFCAFGVLIACGPSGILPFVYMMF